MASVHDPGSTDAVEQLVGFRQDLYGCLTARRDALFELVDALTCRPGRVDYEYTREGTCTVWMYVEPLGGWRDVRVTETKTAVAYPGVT